MSESVHDDPIESEVILSRLARLLDVLKNVLHCLQWAVKISRSGMGSK